jgi:primosomal protein N' (replication factor Y)
MIKKYINVALPVKIDSLFLYSIADGINPSDVIGRRVLVDFNGRMIRGYAVSEGEYTDRFEIKQIKKIIDKRIVFDNDMVDFARWIADYYLSTIGEVLSLMIPKGQKAARPVLNKNFKPKINQLSVEQEKVYRSIKEDIRNNYKRFYLYGVTGSGKTEVYIKLIEDVLDQGKSVIFLVPEIALSYQTLKRLNERFGDLCAVLHSTLKTSVRYGEYLRLFDGEAKLVVGPRSAVLSPLKNIGLIIIDEENEGSYKSEENPRFHARTVSQYLAIKYDAILLLGSATPSVESWYYAKKGFFRLYSLFKRYADASLPEIDIIDCTKFNINKNITLPLVEEINKRLQKKEQVVLLQNRRGFSSFIKCKSCGHIFTCPRCSISLTYHKVKDKLLCHHCGYALVVPKQCPNCKDIKLLKIGAGTQRIEDEISETFPYARIQRIDQDILKSDLNYREILDKIENNEVDILVGTQMIAKGFHFPNIKFVGIINADLILNIPDYKASERAFSLITQVAGRAGRVGDRGYVMIQTMNPTHYSITASRNNNYEEFYNQEIVYRKAMGMPPFYRLLRLVVRGREEKKVYDDISKIIKLLEPFKCGEVEMLGPAPCLMLKINNNFRYHILLKSKKIDKMQSIVKSISNDIKLYSKNYLEIDVDPISLY